MIADMEIKTEVARLIADILHDEGILPTNNFIETDRSGLVAGYVGQTAEKTHKLFKSALNGVLFIDEAYSLANGSDNDFGKEAIDALITDMENYRGKICVILAGYKKPMENMIHLNPGFDSRINRKIDFPDYDMEELLEIAKMILKNKKYTITEDAIQEIGKILTLYSQFDNFANARTVRNVLESLTEIQALRTDIEGLKDNFLIKIEDVLEYESDHNINFENKKVEYHSFNLSYRDFVNYSKSHDVKKYVNLLLRFCYGMTKACHRSRKYSLLGGGIDTNSCQNRPVFFPLLHNGHDSTTSNYPGVVKDLG